MYIFVLLHLSRAVQAYHEVSDEDPDYDNICSTANDYNSEESEDEEELNGVVLRTLTCLMSWTKILYVYEHFFKKMF